MSLLDVYNLRPVARVYELNVQQLESIFTDIVEKETGIAVPINVFYDDESLSIYAYILDKNEQGIEEEDLYSHFKCHDEYGLAIALFAKLTGLPLYESWGEAIDVEAGANEFNILIYANVQHNE